MERLYDSEIENKSASVYDFTINAAAGCQGLVICIGNGLLLATIIAEKSLRSRKEMRIIAGLAVADFLVGGGAVTFAIYRLIMLFIGHYNERIYTAWDCIRLSPTVITYVGLQLSFTMNFIVSIDRYLAVAKPALYRRLHDGYTRSMLSIAGICPIISITALILSTYFGMDRISTFTAMCTGWVYPRWYGIYQFGFAAILSCASVAIYGALFVSLKNRRKSTMVNRRDDQKAVIQRRLTVTLGIISVSTLTFYVVPTIHVAVATKSQPYLMAMVTRISTIVNIAIYIFRQEEIRTGMWKLMTCQVYGTASRGRFTYAAQKKMKESSEICGSIVGETEQISKNDSQLKEALPNVIDEG